MLKANTNALSLRVVRIMLLFAYYFDFPVLGIHDYSILAGIYLIKVNNENTRTNLLNIFKVNNKATKTTSMTSFWWLSC